MNVSSPLDSVIMRAGAVIVGNGASRAAAHYGSPAGELSVCLRTVGLADRSDLGHYVLAGRPRAVAEIVSRVAGVTIAPSGVAVSAGAWWCAEDAGTVLVICEPAQRARLPEMLRAAARPLGHAAVRDVTETISAIALLGPRTLDVLSCFDVLGPGDDPRAAPPFARVRLSDIDTHLLLQSDRSALVLCEANEANRLWRALAQAGRRFGMSCVGKQAIERVALLDRRVGGSPAAAIR